MFKQHTQAPRAPTEKQVRMHSYGILVRGTFNHTLMPRVINFLVEFFPQPWRKANLKNRFEWLNYLKYCNFGSAFLLFGWLIFMCMHFLYLEADMCGFCLLCIFTALIQINDFSGFSENNAYALMQFWRSCRVNCILHTLYAISKFWPWMTDAHFIST